MGQIEISLDQLRCMIGLNVAYQGIHCLVVEVLEDGPSLVLQDLRQRTVQNDQFGEPHRRVSQTYTVPVLTADRLGLHPDFLALDLLTP